MRVIGLTGYAGSGKDEVARILVEQYGYKRYAHADLLKRFVYASDPEVRLYVDRFGEEYTKRNVLGMREKYQDVGLAAREVFGEDFWVDRLRAQIAQEKPERVVITDVRFDNEARRVRQSGGTVIEVRRPGVGPANEHASEQLPSADFFLENAGDLTDLLLEVMSVVEAQERKQHFYDTFPFSEED